MEPSRETIRRGGQKERSRRQLTAFVALAALVVLAIAWVSLSGERPATGVVAYDATPDRFAPEFPVAPERAPAGPSDQLSTDAVRAVLPIEHNLRVFVYYADGAPAPGARLMLHDARAALAEDRTDENGRATLRCSQDALERELWIAVAGVGLGVHDEALAEGLELAPEVAIHLPHAGHIAGRVTVEGQSPLASLELTLHGQEERPATLSETLWIQMAGLNQANEEPWQTARVSAGDGSFEFRGISETAHLSIHPPAGYHLWTKYGLRDNLGLAGAVEDLVIDLAPFTGVNGRVVLADGSPAEKAWICFEVVGSEAHEGGKVVSDVLGNFEIELPPRWSRLHVDARTSDQREAGSRRFEDALVLPGPGDLGSIVLEATDSYIVRVRERDGPPIEGARISWNAYGGDFQSGYEGVLTGRDGAVELHVPPYRSLRHVYVSAEGFRAASSLVLDETVDVELERPTELVVTVRAADGGCLGGTGFGVELVSREVLLDEHWNLDNRAYPSFPTGLHGSRKDGLDRYWIGVDPSCEVRVVGIAVGVPVVLRLLDPIGFVTAEISVPETSSSTRLELVAEHAHRPVFGRVLAPSGEPVHRALVIADRVEESRHDDLRDARAFTDREGRFRFETCAPSVWLLVQADGYKALRSLSADPDGSPHELRMEVE